MKHILGFLLITYCLSSKGQTFLVTDFGAIGDGTTVNTAAIQWAIDSCHSVGGGEVVFSGGDFVTGTIQLKSNVTIRIEGGSELRGSSSIAHYPDIEPSIPTYINNYTKKALIHAQGQHHISIVGDGTINGQGVSLAAEEQRPFGIRFISCHNVTIEDVRLESSGFWMMNNLDVDTMVIRNVDIFNHAAGNNDGLSLDGCRNVLIEGCTVDSNNDPIVIKTTSPALAENIEIRDCTVATWKRAIKIGTETHSGVRNIHIHDINVQWSSLAIPLFNIGVADCGINLAIVDGGFMENVLVEDITIEGVNTAIFIRLGNRGHVWEPGLPPPNVGYLRNVTLRNITATQESNITCSITGIPEYRATNVLLENVNIGFPGGGTDLGAGFVVPENEEEKPENFMFGEDLPSFGLYVRHVDSLTLENVCFTWDVPDSRPGIILDDVTNTPNYLVPVSGTTNCAEVSSKIDDPSVADNAWIDVNGILHLGSEWYKTELNVFDESGRMVWTNVLDVTEVDLSDLRSGIYIASMNNGLQSATLKFIR